MKQMTSPVRTCSTREVANLLGISVRTAQLWVEEGRLNAWKTPGGHRRILRESVERLLEEQRQAGLHRGQGQRVLVLNDNPGKGKELQTLLVALLPGGHIEILDAFEGLIRIGERTPDVIIADLDPAVGENFRLLETLARSTLSGGVLKILLVGSEDHWEAARSRLDAEFLVLMKPVDGRELASLIRALVPLQAQKRSAP